MMKKYVALGVALVLLLSLTACGGKGDKEPNTDPTAVTDTTTVGDVTDSTTAATVDGTTVTDGDATTATTATTQKPTTTTTTTQYVPDGTQVPIGTRPPTTTTTKKPTAGNTSATTGATTSALTTTTTTTTAAKPTDPPADQHYIALPEIGTDIDVVNKRNRIRVSGALAWYNEDGTIGVSLTFKNYTTNWITEEDDYVRCTIYGKNGEVLKTETIHIGVIDTKKHPVRTYEFTVPADAYEVRITHSEIVYWTEWS